MKYLIWLYKIVICLCSSGYMTFYMNQYTLTTGLQIVFVYSYFFAISLIVLFLYEKYIKKKIKFMKKRLFTFASVIIALCVIFVFKEQIIPEKFYNNNIVISSSQNNNEKSLGNEVWITQIQINNKDIALSSIELPNGWFYKKDENALYANLLDKSFEPFTLHIENMKVSNITFVKHAWSGIVSIDDGHKTLDVDLYNKDGDSYLLSVYGKSNIMFNERILLYICILSTFIALIYFIFCAAYGKCDSKYLLSIYYLFITFGITRNMNYIKNAYLFFILLLCFHYFFQKIINCDIMNKYKKRYNIVIMFLINSYITFSICGNAIFLSLNKLTINIQDVIIFILISFAILPANYCVLYVFEKIGTKRAWKREGVNNAVNNKKLNILSGFITLILTLIFEYLLINIIKPSIDNGVIIFLIAVISSVLVLAIIYKTLHDFAYSWNSNRVINPKSIYSFSVRIVILIESFTILILNPALMTVDSFDQYLQAHRLVPLSDHHPVFHTLIEMLLYSLWDTPIVIALFQIVLFALIIAYATTLLYKMGYSFRIVCMYLVITCFMPNVNINIVTLWKDILYSVMLLGVTILIAKRIIDSKKFYNSLWNYFFIILATCLIGLVRHNGIIVVAGVLILLLWDSIRIKSLKPIILIASVIIVMFGTKNLINYYFDVIPNGNIASVIPIHGMAYVSHEKQLSDIETIDFLEEYMPRQILNDKYSQYSASSYMYGEDAANYNTLNKFREADLQKVISFYLKTFIQHPYLILKDRLYGTDLLWNTTQGQSSYNYRYATLYELNSNTLGIVHEENIFSDFYFKIVGLSTHGIFDIFTWRVGIYINILLLLMWFCITNKDGKGVACLIPIGCNIISLMLSMAWQDYRYVFNVFLCFGFIVLFIIGLKRMQISQFNM